MIDEFISRWILKNVLILCDRIETNDSEIILMISAIDSRHNFPLFPWKSSNDETSEHTIYLFKLWPR